MAGLRALRVVMQSEFQQRQGQRAVSAAYHAD